MLKEPWQMTLAERLSGIQNIRQRHGVASAHAKAVQQALSEGKPVPPEVLADYPDLTKEALC